MRCALLVLLVACGTGASTLERPEAAIEHHALGMNDVSILLPLPRDPHTPVLATIAGDGAPLVDRDRFDALVTARHDLAPKSGAAITFDDFHVVAVRFDLCDRSAIGVCPGGAPGRLRLVLQPLYTSAGTTFAYDVAVHTFHAIAADELASVVVELRALARIQDAPPNAPLAVSPAAAAGNPAYLARLRALVLRYARAANLTRMTVIGQIADSAAFAWIFRGIDRSGEAFVPLVIPGIDAAQQTMLLAGGDTVYHPNQFADLPAGFAFAINGAQFAAATSDQRTTALEALTAIQNPTLHDTVDTQCIGCHVATYLTARRAMTSGKDTVSGPNPDDASNYAEHVVHARGKRTRFTSVSTSKDAIRDFGEQLWKLAQPKVTDDGHVVVTHEQLLQALRALLQDDDERMRELAARALPRSVHRREALVDWRYRTDGIERKDRISWAEKYIRTYFTRC